MTRPTHILLASLLLTATATAQTPALAPASTTGPPSSAIRDDARLGGLWLDDGVDASGRPFTGSLCLLATPCGLFYTRSVADPDGRTREEQGDARLLGGRLFLFERPATSGLTSQLGGGACPVNDPRRAVYQAAAVGPHQLVGRFTGGSRGGGRERLRRADADNSLELLVDTQAFPRIFEALRGAKRSIYLQTFSWFDDATGTAVAELLVQKKREGLDVRCLVEAIPQKSGVGWKVGKYLKEQGVDLRLHHTLSEGFVDGLKRFGKRVTGLLGRLIGRSPPPPVEERGLLNHDHRKLIVVDGRIGFTGGMNIADKYANAITWHDIHCRVEGSAVRRMQDTFADRWRASGGKGDLLPACMDAGPGDYPVEVVDNIPGLHLDITRRYCDEIDRATTCIKVENAYLLYDAVVNRLKKRAAAGVDVTAIIPSNEKNDEAMIRDAFLWIQNDVVRSGIKLYKYTGRMCHGKVAIFDGRVATVGSANLDGMAMERNAEINVFVTDRRFAAAIDAKVFQTDIPHSEKAGVIELSFWKKLKSGALHMIRSFL